MSLQVASAVVVPVLFVLGLALLYGRSDPSEWCGWCENISCVEFPVSDPWWGCDDCNIYGFEVSSCFEYERVRVYLGIICLPSPSSNGPLHSFPVYL